MWLTGKRADCGSAGSIWLASVVNSAMPHGNTVALPHRLPLRATQPAGRSPPTTPFEIDGATHVWESPARYAQFRAPAFPTCVPCRSRCPALVSLARARTSDDIQPRALCTPPPKSSAFPRTFRAPPSIPAINNKVESASFRAPRCASPPIVTFGPHHCSPRQHERLALHA
jgi:hypothetical protein